MSEETERWRLEEGGRVHELTVAEQGLRRLLTWSVDGEEVARRATSDERVVLVDDGGRGAVAVRLPTFVGPARRVTWWGTVDADEARVRAHAGVGGTDFVAVSEAARRREEWIRQHPRRFAARRVLAAVVRVALPLLLLWLLARVALPAIPWPTIPWPQITLPRIPWPDIPWPQIPWPDIRLPRIPWPDWRLPAWVDTVRDAARYVVPVLVAAVLAHAEVQRRRRQDDARRGQEDDARRGQEEDAGRSLGA